MRKTAQYILALIFIFSAAACAPKSQVLDSVQVWPKAPKEPRVAYLETYHGVSDFREPSFTDWIFGKPNDSMFVTPYGVFVRDNKLYIALPMDGRVAVYDKKARNISYIGDKGRGKLGEPLFVAIAANGSIYVSDTKSKAVFGFGQDGSLQVIVDGNNEFVRPTGIAINDELQRLYVSDTKDHKIKVFSLTGKPLFQFGKRGKEDGEFNFPLGICVDKRNGNILVVDAENFRVQVFDQDGKFLSKFGVVGDAVGAFGMPKAIAIDREGNRYVTDGFMQNFQIFDQDGKAGLYIMGAEKRQVLGRFQHPGGIFVDAEDRIYLTDNVAGVVQVYQYLSEPWKKTHPEEYKHYLDLQPLEPAPPEGAGGSSEK